MHVRKFQWRLEGNLSARRCAAAALMVAAAAQTARAEPSYSILDLGTLGGTRSKAYDVNNNGRVVGFSETSTGVNRGFRTAANSPINPAADNLGTLMGGSRSNAYGINSAGTVVGDSATFNGDRAFRYATSMSSLGTLGGDWSYAFGINDSNQVVGGAGLVPFRGPTHAFLYSGTSMHDLGTLGGANSYASAINKNGWVVGYSQHDPTVYWEDRAFLWQPTAPNATTGSMTNLGTLGGTYSYAWSINDANQVVGASLLTGDVDYHAMRAVNGERIDLGTLGGTYSEGFDINLSGDIVGAADNAADQTRAFLFANGTMYDLNDLLPSGSGWVLEHARAVNDSGQIVGWGINPVGQTRGFLLTPTARDSVWNVNSGGDWSSAGNWLHGVPNAAGKAANFTAAINSASSINVDGGGVTVGRISFDNAQTYTLSGSAITLDTGPAGGSASITVLSGSHAIAAPIVLNVPLVAGALAPTSTLTLSGNISSSPAGAGAGLVKRGAGTLVLSGNNSYSGGTEIAGGVLSVGHSTHLGSGPADLTFSGAGTLRASGFLDTALNIVLAADGGAVDTNGFDAHFASIGGAASFTKAGAGNLRAQQIQTGAVSVNAGRLSVVPGATAGEMNAIASLTTAAGGQFDLSDHRLIVTAMPLESVESLIRSGRNGGAWDGSGIITSMSAAQTGLTTLGAGVSAGGVLVMYTYAGDANLDGFISGDDYTAIDFAISTPGASGYANGDFNYDGSISGDDYTVIDFNIVAQGAPFATAGALSAAVAVPEPGLVGMALLAGVFLRRRRCDCV